MSDSDGDVAGVPLLESPSPSASPEPGTSGKRKRDSKTETETETKTESKRAAKRRKSKKPKDITDEAIDEAAGVNHAIAHMDSQLVADHIAQRTKRFQSDLSLVELDDLRVPSSMIMDTTKWQKARDLDQLPPFLESFVGSGTSKERKKQLSSASEAKGSPHTIVIAGAGLRAADLTRALRKYQSKDAMVAKLFAKHIKLKEAAEMAKKTRMGIGVGTPQRIIDLLDNGALSLVALESIVIDASHIDQKKRGILDMKETQAPLVKLLCRQEFKETGEGSESRVKLLFY